MDAFLEARLFTWAMYRSGLVSIWSKIRYLGVEVGLLALLLRASGCGDGGIATHWVDERIFQVILLSLFVCELLKC